MTSNRGLVAADPVTQDLAAEAGERAVHAPHPRLAPRWTPKSGQYDQLDILAGYDPSTEGRE